MSSIEELGYLNQTSLLWKDLKIREAMSNVGQNDRLSFVSLYYQINDGRTAIESVVACVLINSGSQPRVQGNTKEGHVTFVK